MMIGAVGKRRALAGNLFFTVFIPAEGADDEEAGELIYYRVVDGNR